MFESVQSVCRLLKEHASLFVALEEIDEWAMSCVTQLDETSGGLAALLNKAETLSALKKGWAKARGKDKIKAAEVKALMLVSKMQSLLQMMLSFIATTKLAAQV